jgi:phosphate starvation-inducible PhoH-like protein
VRGNAIHLSGASARVAEAERLLAELIGVVERGSTLSESDMTRAIAALRDFPDVRLRDVFQDVVVTASKGKQIAPRGIAQKLYIQAMRDCDVVFGAGPAGTGKTYLAVAMAVAALQEQRITRIILTRPAVEAGEKLGFLPGDLAEKVNPYLRPLYDALHDMMPADRVNGLVQRGAVEVAPLAFMRGRTLSNSFVILDEAQNTTVPQMRMFLTRLGMGSKAVITGDVTQVDLPPGVTSGLRDAISLLSNTQGIRCCTFTDADVVRHPLVQRIVRAYDQRDNDRRRRDEGER